MDLLPHLSGFVVSKRVCSTWLRCKTVLFVAAETSDPSVLTADEAAKEGAFTSPGGDADSPAPAADGSATLPSRLARTATGLNTTGGLRARVPRGVAAATADEEDEELLAAAEGDGGASGASPTSSTICVPLGAAIELKPANVSGYGSAAAAGADALLGADVGRPGREPGDDTTLSTPAPNARATIFP